MEKLSFKSPQRHKLLVIEDDYMIEADGQTYPKFLATNTDYHPIFMKGQDTYVALNYIVMYPEVHVVVFRKREINEAITTNYIQ